MWPTIVVQLFVFAFGLVVGSYLNVVVHRLPRGISTVAPRSRCPRCRARIRPWDNVPVLSFLLLRGRCRHCAGIIHWRYPLLEVVTGACFVLSYAHFESEWLGLFVGCAFCSAMIVLAMIDLEHYILPDAITLPGIALGLMLQPWITWATPRDALLGVVVGAGVPYAVGWAWYRLRGVWGMGLGDVKMLAMVGAFVGWQGVVFTLFLASLAGSLVGAAGLVSGRLHSQSKLPFGFYLAPSAVLALFVGRDLLATYLRAFS